jgi:SWI/SNF-related matrix-associated actin-dependent regulator of chromatin subfamily D
MSPPEPIVINYTIRTDVSSHAHPKCFDIEFEMDDPVKTRVNQALATFDQEGGKEIVGLDEEVSLSPSSVFDKAPC